MNWTMILIGFSLAVLMGAGLSSLLVQLRPAWSSRRRSLAAASLLPLVTVLATTLGLLWTSSLEEPSGSNIRDLASKAVATVGVGFAVLGFIGGLLGAALAQRRRAR